MYKDLKGGLCDHMDTIRGCYTALSLSLCCLYPQNGNTALSIARRLGYISVVDTLKVVTEETMTTVVRKAAFPLEY